jgi:hypothetical protein
LHTSAVVVAADRIGLGLGILRAVDVEQAILGVAGEQRIARRRHARLKRLRIVDRQRDRRQRREALLVMRADQADREVVGRRREQLQADAFALPAVLVGVVIDVAVIAVLVAVIAGQTEGELVGDQRAGDFSLYCWKP